jgi:hypothetical protein
LLDLLGNVSRSSHGPQYWTIDLEFSSFQGRLSIEICLMLAADIPSVSRTLENTINNVTIDPFSWISDDPRAKIIVWEPIY